MKNYPWGHARRFNSQAEYMRKLFGERVQKLALDAGFSCPNRDGTKGRGGCTYCNNNAFNPSYCEPGRSITEQLDLGIGFHRRRYRRVRSYLAYFQAYTNTYEELGKLVPKYEEALSHNAVIGLVVGTRPDCMPDELLDYFKKVSADHFVVVEYGIESCYNDTLKRINRGHSFEDSVNAIERTAARGIRQGAHFIIGLPGEDRPEIIGEMRLISEMPVNQVKFHQLQIVRNTAMARDYQKNPGDYQLYSAEEYLELMVEIMEQLNPHFVVERIAGEVNPGYLAGPSWDMRYDQVLSRFEELLEAKNTWQGKKSSYLKSATNT